jgi:3-phenylpropionate/trans-cinnamate dioxygenase ferredoxin reductase subunit
VRDANQSVTTQTHVIVGAGLAGAYAAAGLREDQFDGRIVLIGAEPELPYERPPLSKDYLRGEAPREQALAHPAGRHEELGIELRTSTEVTEIDRAAGAVVLGGGERLAFDRLLLATGAEPRRLRVPGADLAGIHVLRTFADSDALAAVIRGGGTLAVVGGGWIGSEVAASARMLGADVVLIEGANAPLERVLGPEIGGFYGGVHADQGVRLLTGTGVTGFEGADRVERVRLADGRAVECDAVLMGVGVQPSSSLAAACGLERADDGGVLVDARLRTGDERIFAAGDVAASWHPLYDRNLRVEHWANARDQGRAAASAMLGRSVVYDRVPYFFSDQYDVGMEYAGLAAPGDELVVRGSLESREFVAFWLDGERVTAGMNVNVWDVNEAIQALVRARRPVDVARLRDPDVPIEELAAVAS